MNLIHMPRTVVLLASILALPAPLIAATKPEAEAQTAAGEWLALVDDGRYAESWQNAAEYFRKAVPQAQWEQSLSALRRPLGRLVSRKFKSATYAKSLPGAPDGEYVILQFDTEFENKAAAVETVTPMMEKNGTWKVSGYYIR